MISGKHFGCHLKFFKTPNDDKVSSARFLKNNAYTTRIHQEKNFIPNYQVHRKSTKFLLDYTPNHLLQMTPKSCKYVDRKTQGNFSCKHENTFKSMEFPTLWKYFWSLTVHVMSAVACWNGGNPL